MTVRLSDGKFWHFTKNNVKTSYALLLSVTLCFQAVDIVLSSSFVSSFCIFCTNGLSGIYPWYFIRNVVSYWILYCSCCSTFCFSLTHLRELTYICSNSELCGFSLLRWHSSAITTITKICTRNIKCSDKVYIDPINIFDLYIIYYCRYLTTNMQ